MEIVNKSGFQFAFIAGRINYPKHSLTLIVKATFDLLPGKPAVLSEEQFYPTGDEFYPEDKEMMGGPRYASDFAYFKPRADLLLVGKCHPPQSKKVYSSSVKFQVGSKSKSLNVFGNRHWTGSLSNAFSNPEPFSEIELRYENSFGGEGYEINPVGKGTNKIENGKGEKIHPLPNITNAGEQILSHSAKLQPAGFGAINQIWKQRFSKLGSYKGSYLKERWPWFPKDFDWGYFNAAPADMQVSGYLNGDEKLYFENLHPLHSQYDSQLPVLTVRCFIDESIKENQNHFKEIKMNLDTLWTDIENEKLVLVWRGFTDVKDEEFEEIRNILIVSEKIGDQPKTVQYYNNLLEQEMNESEEEFIEPVEVVETEDIEMEKELAKADQEMEALLIESGFDPDNLPQSEEDKKQEEEILKQLGFKEEKSEEPLTRELLIERVNRKESFEGEDLRGIDLSELNLSGLVFQNAIISNVNLKNSDLSNSDFTGADLSFTDLSGAKLNNAFIKEADLTKSILTNSNLSGAMIEGSIFEEAKMHNSQLNEVKGKNSFFAGADLTEAKLLKSDFTDSDFSKCIMDKANFQGSNLKGASIEGASGIQANLSETDLTGLKASGGCNFKKASFQNAKGLESIWEKANLAESDFSFSEMEGANFSSAIMEKAKLYAANMKFARFTKTNLTNAAFTKMNLFQGSMEKANLTGTDLSGSNLYGVEFLDSIIKGTKFTLANLKMTKLSDK
ncbi:MAG: DUF2169 domain-containing protein [Ignavibacteria bacterium]